MSARPVSVAVLVSAGRHPVSGKPRPCRGDAVALVLGRALAGDRLRVIHAGDPEDPALQDYLALGAGCIEVVAARPGADAVAALAGLIADVDLILTGGQAEQGAGSGLLPYALAHVLGRPIVANVLEAQVEDGEVRVRQFLPKGRRRGILAPLPVVLAVHPLAPVGLSYAYARRMSGRIQNRLTDGLTAEAPAPTWKVETVRRQPVRLRAEDKTKSAHSRLLSAIASEAKGGVVAIEGSSVDKAQVMLTFLRENRLIDF